MCDSVIWTRTCFGAASAVDVYDVVNSLVSPPVHFDIREELDVVVPLCPLDEDQFMLHPVDLQTEMSTSPSISYKSQVVCSISQTRHSFLSILIGCVEMCLILDSCWALASQLTSTANCYSSIAVA